MGEELSGGAGGKTSGSGHLSPMIEEERVTHVPKRTEVLPSRWDGGSWDEYPGVSLVTSLYPRLQAIMPAA